MRRIAVALATTIMGIVFAITVSGCSDLRQFDEDAIASQATEYMQDKYGETLQVNTMWEDSVYGLLGSTSANRVFATMSDGTVVVVGFGENSCEPIMDNKQSDEICVVYDRYISDIATAGADELKKTGYNIDDVMINGEELGGEPIASSAMSLMQWEDGGQSLVDSFFHTKYDGDMETFVASERPAGFGCIGGCVKQQKCGYRFL